MIPPGPQLYGRRCGLEVRVRLFPSHRHEEADHGHAEADGHIPVADGADREEAAADVEDADPQQAQQQKPEHGEAVPRGQTVIFELEVVEADRVGVAQRGRDLLLLLGGGTVLPAALIASAVPTILGLWHSADSFRSVSWIRAPF